MSPPTNGFGSGYSAYASWCSACGGTPSNASGVSCTPGPNWGHTGGAAGSPVNSAIYNGVYSLSYQLGYKFGQWLFGGGGETAQQRAIEEAQQQAMMAEIARRQAEAERLHQEEEARRLEAMYNRLAYALKHRDLPELQMKTRGCAGGTPGIQGLPGIYLNCGQDQAYGIPGLPGMYVGGPGQGSGLALKTRDSEAANAANNAPAPAAPADTSQNPPPPSPDTNGSQAGIATDTGLQYKSHDDANTSSPSAAAPASDNAQAGASFDPGTMTPQQLADAADAFSKLPPDQQQRIMTEAQQNSAGGQPPAVSHTSTAQPAQPSPAAASTAAQASAPSTPQPAASQPAASNPVQPNSSALTQLQQQSAASQAAAANPSLEGASAQARAGFDQPLAAQPSAGPVPLTGTTPALLRAPEPPPPPASGMDTIKTYLFPATPGPSGAFPTPQPQPAAIFAKDPNPPLENPLREEQWVQARLKAWDDWATQRDAQLNAPPADNLYPAATERQTLDAAIVKQYAPELLARYQSDPAFRRSVDRQLFYADELVAPDYYQKVAEVHKRAILAMQAQLDQLAASGAIDKLTPLADQFAQYPERRQLVQAAQDRISQQEQAAVAKAQADGNSELEKEYQSVFQRIRAQAAP